jgi:hypothetical protein
LAAENLPVLVKLPVVDTKDKDLVPDLAFRMGFEGGQNPLLRRMPKFGFTKPNREKREVDLFG